MPTLSETVREQGIQALFATLYARHPLTASLAQPLYKENSDPHDRLLQNLMARPDGWAAWLVDPEHASAAESMISALSDDDMRLLEFDTTCAELFTVLQDVRMNRATNIAVAAAYVAAAQATPEVIDLRETATTSR